MFVLKIIGGLLIVGLFVYGKYRQQRWISDQREQKSEVQTLFGGEK
jgi:hypothetical protein